MPSWLLELEARQVFVLAVLEATCRQRLFFDPGACSAQHARATLAGSWRSPYPMLKVMMACSL